MKMFQRFYIMELRFHSVYWFLCFLSSMKLQPHLPPSLLPNLRVNTKVFIHQLLLFVEVKRVYNFTDFNINICYLVAPLVTTVGLVNPEPKTREGLLKCESNILFNIKLNKQHSLIVFGEIQSLH